MRGLYARVNERYGDLSPITLSVFPMWSVPNSKNQKKSELWF
jgi:hypothetical protein